MTTNSYQAYDPFLRFLAKADGGSVSCVACQETYVQFQPDPTVEQALEMHWTAEHDKSR